MLVRPAFVPPNIGAAEIKYPWDEWHVAKSYEPADPDLLKQLADLTHRAQVGLAIATAEWIAWRFKTLTDERMPLEYLEAAWAANVHLAYAEHIDTDDDEWRGPILGPLNVALTIVIDALFFAEQSTNTAIHPAWLFNLARLVIPATGSFEQWYVAVVDRLQRYYRALPEEQRPLFDQDDYTIDPPVPREAFDMSREFNIEEAPSLVDRYLRSLDVEENRFLMSREELKEMGFGREPYTFRIERLNVP